jgi:hypothetical protein
MIILVAGALLYALAADPASATPRDASRAGDDSQRGSRDPAAGGNERTGPPGAGVESGDANSMAGGRTDEGPRGGTGIREGGDRIRKDHQRARANAQARGRNKKGSLERPADTPAQMNRNPRPIGSGGPSTPKGVRRPEGRNYVEGPQHGAAGGVASAPEEGSGGSSTRGVAGKGAETQPDKKETGSEPSPKR